MINKIFSFLSGTKILQNSNAVALPPKNPNILRMITVGDSITAGACSSG